MTRQLKDPAARQRIVDAAWRLVSSNGVSAATMRAIALEAGVSTGAVTHYFDDKAEVMTAVIRANTKRIARRVNEARHGKRGLAAVEAVAETLLPLDDEMQECWMVLISFWGHPAAARFLKEEGSSLGFEAIRQVITTLLEQAADQGELPSDVDVKHEAERIVALLCGIGLIAGGFEESRESSRRRARRMLDELIADMRA
ncbi:TetR/AcrR family transcriptional regulator [Thermocrispum municipale]|uniref:TetR/AcrR family transcriptional regulator n=1 Tax=Thermocrispum municipale TaxID=37926 RepID=UPI0004210C88|nr:TetR/AcrR family transcriptional regulator [Thermocrispum municipale]